MIFFYSLSIQRLVYAFVLGMRCNFSQNIIKIFKREYYVVSIWRSKAHEKHTLPWENGAAPSSSLQKSEEESLVSLQILLWAGRNRGEETPGTISPDKETTQSNQP